MLVDSVLPDFIFLSETQTFQHEAKTAIELCEGAYSCSLNSDDLYDSELPFIKNRSNGGTMILWKKTLDKCVSILPTVTSSFLPLLFQPPGSPPSLHLSLYLPTSGKETEFTEELAKLRQFLDDILEDNPDCAIYIRGDSNVNLNNKPRVKIFSDFMNNFNLTNIPLGHKTYHHFTGDGLFDSAIDVILCTDKFGLEEIKKVFCQHEYPFICSHHDAIVSTCSLPCSSVPTPHSRPEAPVIQNTRMKTVWDQESILDYQSIIGDSLEKLRVRWADSSSSSCASTLFKVTSDILNSAASSTNKSVSLATPMLTRKRTIPPIIRKSMNQIKRKFNFWKQVPPHDPSIGKAVTALKTAKTKHRRLIRALNSSITAKEDQRMFSSLSSDSSTVFKKIRSVKSSKTSQIPFLTVGDNRYDGDSVKDGFFASIKELKSRDSVHALADSFIKDYNHILDICRSKIDLPRISLGASNKILKDMKASVKDHYSITPAHFLNAGKHGLLHFNFLLNYVIDDINNAKIEELNSCYALLLLKNHGKSRTKDSSYRTISTCPMVSKALDIYIRDLHKDKWSAQEAPTQYQGVGSCHELAALLVTEVIQHSVWSLKEPAYLLFLDAKSAFDKVLPELLVRNLYKSGMEGNSVNFINNRLKNRRTYLDWDKTIMGPIYDELGLEQGGSNSSEYYKLYSNENLISAQKSEQGINLGNYLGKSVVISAVGLADDSVVVANKLSRLSNILFLTKNYCSKYGVTISHEKTKLLRISNNKTADFEAFNPISIDNHTIDFSEEAEHVGVIRSSDKGNLPHLMNRISAHKRALAATLSSGIAQKSRASPAVGIRLQKVYGSPVLLSGVASLYLSGSEISLIDKHLKITYQNIQKLLPNTPSCVTYFLSGSLPGEALIHLRMLGIFGMVARLTHDPLRIHARNVFVAEKSSSKSWFHQIREICLGYGLPHPITILDTQPSKKALDKLVVAKVISYWETRLRGEAALLSSLSHFKPEFMSLKNPHPIWSTTEGNPYEVSKAIQQARFLSGRYRSENLVRHWSKNKDGFCNSVTCTNQVETVEHILIHCRAYTDCKRKLYSLWLSATNPVVLGLVLEAFTSERCYFLQFILDCSVLPSVIAATQKHGFSVPK